MNRQQRRTDLHTDVAEVCQRVASLEESSVCRLNCDAISGNELRWFCNAVAKGLGAELLHGVDLFDSSAVRHSGYGKSLSERERNNTFDFDRLTEAEAIECRRLLDLIDMLPP